MTPTIRLAARRGLGLVAALVLTLTTVATQASPGPADADARFESMLRGIDVVPTLPQLEAAWPDARARLLDAARDDARDTYTRSRALSMLSFYPDAGVREALVTLAAHADVEVRQLAVYTVARAYGTPGDADLVALVERAAADPDADVRAKAVRGLRWIDHPAAEAALQRIARETRDDRVRRLTDWVKGRRASRMGR